MVDRANTETDTSGSHTFISELSDILWQFDLQNFAKGHHYNSIKIFIPNALMSCDKLWLRGDQVRKHLKALYTGPYKLMY